MKTKNMTTLDLRNWKRRSEPMKTTKLIRTRGLLMIVAAASFVAVTVNAAPGDLFEADYGSNTIYKFAPNGTQTTFATGLSSPEGLAFDNAGNLFEADFNSGRILEFTPNGTQSTFASALNEPQALAIQPQPQPTIAACIQQPINADRTSVFNVRRGVVPVKFTLTQGGIGFVMT
jgi:DNA-binding beta-propeller fold protein YncE